MDIEKKPIELELKLALPGPGNERAIVEYLRDQGYRVKELKPVENIDLYLDTFDWLLLKKKLSLRYRRSDGKAMYTLKSIEAIEEGIAQRMETEVPLDKPVAVPTDIQVKQIRSRIDEIISPRRLLEHILIRTARLRYRVLSPEGAKIEMAFDTTNFTLKGFHPPRRARKRYELEAELLAGKATALSSLAKLLSSAFSYPPSQASKLESAMECFKIVIPSKKPPEKYLIRLDDRIDLAVRKILTYQLARFQEQLPGLHRDIDTEFVHQARVTTRRMRSSLRLFRDAIPRSTGEFLAGELKWLGGILGAVRDLDVFLLNLENFREQLERYPAKQKRVLEDWIAEHRYTSFTTLRDSLASPRYISFERRLLRYLAVPLPSRPRAPLALKLVRHVAPSLINEKLEAVIEQGSAVLANPKIKEFHLLRIQMKKLRYACEFMAPAYGEALDPFIERTVEIQDCLGEIQDTVFTRDFVTSLCKGWKRKIVSPDLMFLLGEIYQLQGGIASDRQRRFSKIWERFASEETIRQLKEVIA